MCSGFGKVLDTSAPVGERWPEGEFLLTDGPLNVALTVLGYDETITVAANEGERWFLKSYRYVLR